MIGKKTGKKKRKKDGLSACLAFLCVMFVLGILSKTLSWQMKPEVTVRDAEYRPLAERVWMRGAVRNGEFIPLDKETAALPEREGTPEITVHTENGPLKDWRDGGDIEDCLIEYVWDYGETANAVPVKCLRDRQDDRAVVSYVERTQSRTSPYVTAQLGMNIHQEAGGFAVLGYSLNDMIIASNKPFENGQSVRLKTDEALGQVGRVEVLPADGNTFSSPYEVWMLKRILPEACTIETETAGGIRRIIFPVQSGERREDVMTIVEATLSEAGIAENTRIFTFLETQRWMSFAQKTRMLILWAAALTVIVICLYRDIRYYGSRLSARAGDEYLKNMLNEEIVGLLIRAIIYAAAIFAVLILARFIGGFDMTLAGRLLPPDRVLDYQHYRMSLQTWMDNRAYYCSLFPAGEGADYYAGLLLEWKKTAAAATGIAAGSAALVWIDKYLYRRYRQLTRGYTP